ncbi:acyl transferase/acyl hydrolase/lysophospholipase [Annulohypoxylon truncatum]|uniref:acyl transferase/acyl hydrolase/lysophospholipase n=1 Tax=Annulohypoxylon truncatum TaxID=327061 RepID=UPI002007AB68|nr:acyl transferase/acyl hydrolase/lysophospholipase [Annulohypoxylon truncatum]KAI1206773.1 acyl transferase/acyl hydrolase/lysophospholipase [Annulohypoxylon truncatum]
MSKAKGKANELSTRKPWLRLLALDGVGVRGLSSLMVFQHLMETLNPDAPPKPCDHFHMIGGTSTGGLIAIMLGRLRMTVGDCITAYTQLSSDVFKKRRHRVNRRGNIQGRFDSRELEKAVKKILAQQGFGEDTLLKDEADAPCKVFVCTRSTSADKVCLTSYRSPRGGSHLLDSVKIWEACRATSAAPSFFDPITIGPFGEEFIDGALGENNPIYSVWNQAQDIWSDGPLQDKILCLISIGTGVPSLKPFQDGVLDMGKALVALSTESEETAERFHQDKASLYDNGHYYRFNVIRGLEAIGLQESERRKEIAAATLRYITSQAVFSQVKNVLGAVNRAADMLRECQRYAAKARIPILFITSLSTECSAIRLGLIQIKKVISKVETASLEEIFQEDVLEEYNAVLESCHLTFYILNKHMSAMKLHTTPDADRSTLKAKLQALSKNPQMDEVSQAIMGLARGVRILCTAFEYENVSRATEILSSPKTKRLVDKISSDSVSLQDSFHGEIDRNATDSRELEYDEQACGIDDLLINTTLYRRAFIRNLIKSQHDEIHAHPIPETLEASDYQQLSDVASESAIIGMQTKGKLLEGPKLPPELHLPNLGAREVDADSTKQLIPVASNESFEVRTGQISNHRDSTTSAIQSSTGTAPMYNNSEVLDGNSHSTTGESSEDLERLTSFIRETCSDTVITHRSKDRYSQPASVRQSRLGAEYKLEFNPMVSGRLPTLYEILSRPTKRPYTLFEFYLYMRDIQRSADYLDFWLDIVQHTSLCRDYVRELRVTIIPDTDSLPALPSSSEKYEGELIISREHIRSSAERIMYTFILSGAERQILLPESIQRDIVTQIEEFGRDDPEVFDMAKDHVFQAIERDAYPRFLNLSQRPFRMFRGSHAIGSWINRVSLRGISRTEPNPSTTGMQRIPPHELFASLSGERPGAPHI